MAAVKYLTKNTTHIVLMKSFTKQLNMETTTKTTNAYVRAQN